MELTVYIDDEEIAQEIFERNALLDIFSTLKSEDDLLQFIDNGDYIHDLGDIQIVDFPKTKEAIRNHLKKILNSII